MTRRQFVAAVAVCYVVGFLICMGMSGDLSLHIAFPHIADGYDVGAWIVGPLFIGFWVAFPLAYLVDFVRDPYVRARARADGAERQAELAERRADILDERLRGLGQQP
ncbi:hypothetical protein [Flindersiella endophytica]